MQCVQGLIACMHKFDWTSPKIQNLQSTLPASIQLVADSNLVHAAGIDKLFKKISLQQHYFFPCFYLFHLTNVIFFLISLAQKKKQSRILRLEQLIGAMSS